ncbi:hypothetical protein EDF18_0973 [Frigoribacterium sp. PhB107]|jgi:hypothetical protein|uniref:phage tail tube protein n=1 Tax=Frigoribacterium sp. PhB107 TaxID=2485172 RepID=UPI000F487F61|nr:hypothetical protein [Frigoribacterium sp. PhB107]ROP78327.1 hypothetical protein EDF18_0973 [Frigoribacterium sp. PhB107]
MVNTASKVVNGKPNASGGVLFAPLGTAFPATAIAAIPTGFRAGGYVSEDGVTKSESRDSATTKDWGGLTIKRTQTGYELTVAFAFLEYLNAEAAKTIYGADNVTVTPATADHGEQMRIAYRGQESPHLTWILDMADGASRTKFLIPDGQVAEIGDTTWSSADAALRDVTLSLIPNADGVFAWELTDDGVKAVTA